MLISNKDILMELCFRHNIYFICKFVILTPDITRHQGIDFFLNYNRVRWSCQLDGKMFTRYIFASIIGISSNSPIKANLGCLINMLYVWYLYIVRM